MLEDDSKFEEVVRRLYTLHADTFTLYLKVWGCHWNIQGSNFPQYHELLNQHYQDFIPEIDRVGETIRSMGYKTPASQRDFLELTNIQETDYNMDAISMIRMLTEDHVTIEKTLMNVAEAAEPLNAQNILTMVGDQMELYRSHIYKLRATLGE